MEFIVLLIVGVLGLQLYLFFFSKKKKKVGKVRDAILDKYKVHTKGDLFKLINSQAIPEEDRLALEEFYQKGI